jgi:hypothetical protein
VSGEHCIQAVRLAALQSGVSKVTPATDACAVLSSGPLAMGMLELCKVGRRRMDRALRAQCFGRGAEPSANIPGAADQLKVACNAPGDVRGEAAIGNSRAKAAGGGRKKSLRSARRKRVDIEKSSQSAEAEMPTRKGSRTRGAKPESAAARSHGGRGSGGVDGNGGVADCGGKPGQFGVGYKLNPSPDNQHATLRNRRSKLDALLGFACEPMAREPSELALLKQRVRTSTNPILFANWVLLDQGTHGAPAFCRKLASRFMGSCESAFNA